MEASPRDDREILCGAPNPPAILFAKGVLHRRVLDEEMEAVIRGIILTQGAPLSMFQIYRALVARGAMPLNQEAMQYREHPIIKEIAGAPIAAQFYGKHLTHALRHLPGRLVGKGQRQYAFGRHGFAKDQMGDAGRDHAGLAAARAGQNQHGSVRGRHGFTLLGIEGIEIGGHPNRFLAGEWNV